MLNYLLIKWNFFGGESGRHSLLSEHWLFRQNCSRTLFCLVYFLLCTFVHSFVCFFSHVNRNPWNWLSDLIKDPRSAFSEIGPARSVCFPSTDLLIKGLYLTTKTKSKTAPRRLVSSSVDSIKKKKPSWPSKIGIVNMLPRAADNMFCSFTLMYELMTRSLHVKEKKIFT